MMAVGSPGPNAKRGYRALRVLCADRFPNSLRQFGFIGVPKLQKIVKIGAMTFVYVADETLGISNRFL